MTRNDFYKVYPPTCGRTDFWGQVKRTVNGKPVDQEQIDMILDAVNAGLKLSSGDVLLDLCCGNGALSSPLFSRCKAGLGVDYSEYLIGVAQEYFARPEHAFLLVADVVEYCATEPDPARFSAAMCYGSFQYLPREAAEDLLRLLHERFVGVTRLFIGNVPDRALSDRFFEDRKHAVGVEDQHDSAIGIWRTREEFSKLAERCGWKAKFSTMPGTFYAAEYKFDVLLTRGEL